MSSSKRAKKERRNGSAEGSGHARAGAQPSDFEHVDFEQFAHWYTHHRHEHEEPQKDDRLNLSNLDWFDWAKVLWYITLALVLLYYGLPLVLRILLFLGKLVWWCTLSPVLWLFGYRSHAPTSVSSTSDVPVPPIAHIANSWRLQECFVSYEHNYCGTQFEAPVVGKYCGELRDCMGKEMGRVGLEVVSRKKRPGTGEETHATETTVDKGGKKGQVFMGTVAPEPGGKKK